MSHRSILRSALVACAAAACILAITIASAQTAKRHAAKASKTYVVYSVGGSGEAATAANPWAAAYASRNSTSSSGRLMLTFIPGYYHW